MTARSPQRDRLLDSELTLLRQEWVDASRAWAQAIFDTSATGTSLTDDQRAALGRYRAAAAAYFDHPRIKATAS